ncbi:MrcB family domain-containing protein [Gracilibacillus sp. D59]|uniref:MrcB family domain-containing protein n=1 Tax=Gracilibacillus sp. D59 TaxID=3457434 RepID=UPI003FCCFBCF
MRATLFTDKDVMDLKKYKFKEDGSNRKNVDKSYDAHKMFVEEVPNILREELIKEGLDLSKTEIRASVGEGRISEVYWLAILNENLVPRNKSGKLTTQKGIYIALLCDSSLENAYLVIGNGAEYLSGNELKELSNFQMDFIESQKLNQGYVINRNFSLFLGKSNRPKNYVKGIPLYKKYLINNIELNELVNDIKKFQVILDLIVLEKGLDEIENEKFIQTDNKRKITSISVEKYEELRNIREKRNKEIGYLAEKFVYEREIDRLLKYDKSWADKVLWRSKEVDGLGYDIESIEKDGSKKYIEVKGTSLNEDNITFYFTNNELNKAKLFKENYVLVLVANVGLKTEPRIIKEIRNPAQNILKDLQPVQYKLTYSL